MNAAMWAHPWDVVDEGPDAESLSFYGYGVLPERNLSWVGDALDGVA